MPKSPEQKIDKTTISIIFVYSESIYEFLWARMTDKIIIVMKKKRMVIMRPGLILSMFLRHFRGLQTNRQDN